jgi:hypothetical protein
MRREKVRGTQATANTAAGLVHADAAKAFVTRYIGRLVADGYAEWDVLTNGDVEVRFHTGETFILAEAVIIRIA